MGPLRHKDNGNDNNRGVGKSQGAGEPPAHIKLALVDDPDNELNQMAGSGMAYSGLSEVAQHLEGICKAIRGYGVDAVEGEHCLNLVTGKNSCPVRLRLEGEAVEKIADSLKQIADAMTEGSK